MPCWYLLVITFLQLNQKVSSWLLAPWLLELTIRNEISPHICHVPHILQCDNSPIFIIDGNTPHSLNNSVCPLALYFRFGSNSLLGIVKNVRPKYRTHSSLISCMLVVTCFGSFTTRFLNFTYVIPNHLSFS